MEGYATVRLPPRKTRGVLYLRNLPAGLKLAFRATVVRRQETMEDVIQELIRKYVTDPACVARWKKKRLRKKKDKE